MRRRRIYLMRHGDVEYFGRTTAYRPAAVELTDEGREQAAAAGRALRGVRIQRIVTSGLPRTVETARAVLRAAGPAGHPPIETWRDFEEFRGTRLTGLTPQNLEAQFLGPFGPAPTHEDRYLEGETVGSLLARVNLALDRLLAADDWDTALLVLHGGVNRAILSRALLGRSALLGHIEQSPGCLNVLDHGPGWFVRAVNVLPDNAAHVGPRTTSIEELVTQYRALRGWPEPV